MDRWLKQTSILEERGGRRKNGNSTQDKTKKDKEKREARERNNQTNEKGLVEGTLTTESEKQLYIKFKQSLTFILKNI